MSHTAAEPQTFWQRFTTQGGLVAVLGDPTDPDWERASPGRTGFRRDLIGALALTLVGFLGLALTESYAGVLEDRPRWWGYAAIAVITLPLIWRRRHPIAALSLGTVAYIAGAYANGQVAALQTTLVAFFAYVYAAVAWGKSRQVVAVAVVMLGIVISVWLLIDLTISSSYRDLVAELGSADGPFDPLTGFTLYYILVNVAFFGGAVYAGRASWRAALRRHRNQEQARTIERQAQELARRAVVDERLRIARELHDVIAHHVSAIGIQAGAARMVLDTDPQAAQAALKTVEGSSRQAVTETRQLLGVLRDDHSGSTQFLGRGINDLEELVREHAQLGLSVTLTTVVDDDVDLDRLPPALGASMYRCVQESLSNVLRHSTARRVSVTLRSLGEPQTRALEIEVLDAGRPRPSGSGSGYGLVGLRERAQLHGGSCESGPRTPGPGWRVRVTFPMPTQADPDESPRPLGAGSTVQTKGL